MTEVHRKGLRRAVVAAVLITLMLAATGVLLWRHFDEGRGRDPGRGPAACQEEMGDASGGCRAPDIGAGAADPDEMPAYTGVFAVEVNGGLPIFSEEELASGEFEYYSELDGLGRAGVCEAMIGPDMMPSEKRGSIGMIRPSGWHTVRYDFIEDKYLYNRCHLIAYMLTGQNANERNLVTGTRAMNVEGMLPYEIRVADYIKDTGNHVLYRATPLFAGDELVCRGLELEARSIEDGGRGLSFNVYVYNEQPGVTIDHQSGESVAS